MAVLLWRLTTSFLVHLFSQTSGLPVSSQTSCFLLAIKQHRQISISQSAFRSHRQSDHKSTWPDHSPAEHIWAVYQRSTLPPDLSTRTDMSNPSAHSRPPPHHTWLITIKQHDVPYSCCKWPLLLCFTHFISTVKFRFKTITVLENGRSMVY